MAFDDDNVEIIEDLTIQSSSEQLGRLGEHEEEDLHHQGGEGRGDGGSSKRMANKFTPRAAIETDEEREDGEMVNSKQITEPSEAGARGSVGSVSSSRSSRYVAQDGRNAQSSKAASAKNIAGPTERGGDNTLERQNPRRKTSLNSNPDFVTKKVNVEEEGNKIHKTSSFRNTAISSLQTQEERTQRASYFGNISGNNSQVQQHPFTAKHSRPKEQEEGSMNSIRKGGDESSRPSIIRALAIAASAHSNQETSSREVSAVDLGIKRGNNEENNPEKHLSKRSHQREEDEIESDYSPSKSSKNELDAWPVKERQQQDMPSRNSSNDNIQEPTTRKKSNRSRGKSEATGFQNVQKKTQSNGQALDALDLEDKGGEYRKKTSFKEETGSEVDLALLQSQRAKKKKGRVEPERNEAESDEVEDTKPKQKKKTASPPAISNSTNTNMQQQQQLQQQQQAMMLYGSPFGFQPQQNFIPGFMPSDYMMQQNVYSQFNPAQFGNQQFNTTPGQQQYNQSLNNQFMQQSVNPQWRPVMGHTPNFGYQQYFQGPQDTPAVVDPSNLVKAIMPVPIVPAQVPSDEIVVGVMSPRPPSSSPPNRSGGSPRKHSVYGGDSEQGEYADQASSAANASSPKMIHVNPITNLESVSSPLPVRKSFEKDKMEEVQPVPPPNNTDTNRALAESVLQQLTTPFEAAAVSQVLVAPVTQAVPIQQQALPPVVAAAAFSGLSAVVPPVTSPEVESSRLAALHSLGLLEFDDHPRLNKITQMTARLLGRSCCVLSLVDSDRVFWKSVSTSSPNPSIPKEEARYESFCSWVVQDDTGRGVTVLDARTDPRCTHMRSKPGLEFYAGVPLILGGKYKIGALSIQGPSSGTQISVIDMNILHEMSLWASGELDTIIQQKTLEDRDTLLKARDKLGLIADKARKQDKESDSRILEKCLAIVRHALRAHCVLLLKLSPEGKGFQSLLQAYSITSAGTKSSHLPIGEDIFRELCSLTLKKENTGAALLLENLKTGPVTKDVDHYLSKKINKCMSEILWNSFGPNAVIAAFFEGTYRTITQEELAFARSIVPPLSSILEHLELKDSFHQAANNFKSLGAALKKHSLPFAKQTGLAPCVMVAEHKLDFSKGYEKAESLLNLYISTGDLVIKDEKTALPSEPKGQALAQVLQKDPLNETKNPKASVTLTPTSPIECFEVLHDFTQILDNLAEKFNLKKARRHGQLFFIFANFGPETGTYSNVASLANELFFSLDTYNQNTRRGIKAQIGIHTDFIPAEIANDNNSLKDSIIALANGAYQLESRADSILTSEIFYHQTKDYCTFETALPMIIRGQGAFSTYRLIGTTEEVQHPPPEAIKENGVNDRGSLILSKVPPPITIEIISPTEIGTTPLKPSPVTSPSKKRCNIM